MSETQERLIEGSTIVHGLGVLRERVARGVGDARVLELAARVDLFGGDQVGTGSTDESETTHGATTTDRSQDAITNVDDQTDELIDEEGSSVASSDADTDSVGATDLSESDTSVDGDLGSESDRETGETNDRSSSRRSAPKTRVTIGSIIYRTAGGLDETIGSSFLYQWLTAEPEPDVIVIDLRETRSIGPLLKQIDAVVSAITEESPATTATSSALRVGYRVRNAFLTRPIRVVSFGAIVAVIASFVGLAIGGSDLGASAFVLFGLLLLAVRGTQSTRSWAAIKETRAYELLCKAFEPPEPMEPPNQDGTLDTGDQSETLSRDHHEADDQY